MISSKELTIADTTIREIQRYIRTRLGQPDRTVDIRFGVIHSHGKDLWDAGLGRYKSGGSVYPSGPLGRPSETLEELHTSIVEDLDGMNLPRGETA